MTPKPPYVGPRPFSVGEENLFFGRARETEHLFDLVTVERLVLLHAPSGAGKTSLVVAGLFPRLRSEGFEVFGPLRVKHAARGDEGAGLRFVDNVLADIGGAAQGDEREARTGEIGRRVSAVIEARGLPSGTDVFLFFDQFEEVLEGATKADAEARERLFEELARALRPQRVHAVFALREEYVGALEPHIARLPRALSCRFRLELLDADAAREALEGPVGKRATFEADATKVLLDDLSMIREQDANGRARPVRGTHVEPVHLQVVALRLWDRLTAGSADGEPRDPVVTSARVEQLVGSVDDVLSTFYDDKVRRVAEAKRADERMIRRWFERCLITPTGLRNQVQMQEGATASLDNAVIDELIDEYLLRRDKRRGVTWFELSHDRFVEPVLRANRRWRARSLDPFLQLAERWEEAGRPDHLLAAAAPVRNARRQVAGGAWRLQPFERDFLVASERAALRRFTERILAAVVFVFLVVAILGLDLMRRAARASEQRAWQSERRASALAAIELARRPGAEIEALVNGVRANALRDGQIDALRGIRRAVSVALSRLVDRATNLNELRISPDGRRVLARSGGRTIAWDTVTGQREYGTTTPQDTGTESFYTPDLAWRVTVEDNDRVTLRSAFAGAEAAMTWRPASGLRVTNVRTSLDQSIVRFSAGGQRPYYYDLATREVVDAADPRVLNFQRGLAPGQRGMFSLDSERPWDVARRAEVPIGAVRGAGGGLAQARYAYSQDGSTLALTTGGALRVLETSSPFWRLVQPTAAGDVDISRDGRWLVAADSNVGARLYDLRGNGSRALSADWGTVQGVAISAAADRVVTAASDGVVRVWNASGTVVASLRCRESTGNAPSTACALDPAEEQTAALLDRRELVALRYPNAEGGRMILGAAPIGDQGAVAVMWSDGSAEVWRLDENVVDLAIPLVQTTMACMPVSPDGRFFLASSARRLELRDARRPGVVLRLLSTNMDAPACVALSEEARTVAVLTADGQIQVWQGAAMTVVPQLPSAGEVQSLAVSANGGAVSWMTRSGAIYQWSPTERVPTTRLQPQGPGEDACRAWFSATGRRAVVAGRSNKVWLVDVAAGRSQFLDADVNVASVCEMPRAFTFSRDEAWVVGPSGAQVATLWNAQTGDARHTLAGHWSEVRSASFDPQGARVVTASRDGHAAVWDVSSGDDLGFFRTPRGEAFVAQFVRGDELLVGGGGGGLVRYPLGARELQVLACRLLQYRARCRAVAEECAAVGVQCDVR